MDKVVILPSPMGHSALQLGPREALQKVKRRQRENTSLSQPIINRNRNTSQRKGRELLKKNK